MSAKTFRTKFEDGFICLPFDVRKEFGRARPPVQVTINGYGYRSTVSVYDGKYFIPVRKSNQDAAEIRPGDMVKATIALDEAPRTVNAPPDLKAALKGNLSLASSWENLSYTTKKEHAEALLQAKKPETRARRLEKILQAIRAKVE